MSLLISSLSEETLPIVTGLSTSKEIWDTLELVLSSTSNTRTLNLCELDLPSFYKSWCLSR
ncbi:hypothetical protein RDI58_018446 [Solanum bulbocastanum]|uniref:Uncharacterized protein n=1 Tax=Solanum bulbocastanum TaxID=147425 RepID=A0AAN8YAZ2_SOLBU